jgi:hypothetical protein
MNLMPRNETPLHLFVFVLGLVLLFLAAFPIPVVSAAWDPWRMKLLAAGLFFWALSTAV